MNRPSRFTAPKKATNISLPEDLVAEAKRLGINLSQACEAGLENEVRQTMAAAWKAENRDAMESWNVWIAENGMPYDEFRQF